MKILLINYEFPPLGGGSSTASKFICKNLAKLGHDVKVLTAHFKDLPFLEEQFGYTVYRVKSIRKRKDRSNIIEMLSFIISSLYPSIKLIKQNKFDIVFAFFSIPGGLVALFLNLIFKTPYVVFLRGGDVPGFILNSKVMEIIYFLLKPLIYFICKKAKLVIANSNGLKELALKSMPNLDIKIINNGVDLEVFKPKNSINKNLPCKLLFCGRLAKQKGVYVLIESLNDIPLNLWHLTVVGDGPERENLYNLAKELNLENNITFKGWIDRENIVSEYQNSDVLVLPSFDEGMSNVILEGLACGLPIVATDISGSNELVINNVNGYLVPVNDTLSLKQAILNLINDNDLREQFSLKSIEIASKYDWKVIVQKLIDLLNIKG